MSNQSKAYKDRIASKEWFDLCRRLKAERNNICDRCGKYYPFLEVHHITYARLGHERDSDLRVLCHQCHDVEDYERREKKQDAHDKRMKSWAVTVYGSNWRMKMTEEKLRREYDGYINRISRR